MNWSEKDYQYIWHPYTHQKDRDLSVTITRGKGSLLYDENEFEYIDGISSWWVNIHGHAHPYIAKKIFEQAKTLEHVIFAGFSHMPAISLAERLLPLLPGQFEKIFYSDNGSTAVEVALKMALQFWSNKNDTIRTKIIAFNNGYHGDTFGAMSTSSRSIFTKAFDEKLFEVVFINVPCLENINELKTHIDSIANETACFIYEPLIQGAGGMKMYDKSYLNELLIHLKGYNILCIADEVMTGFFRTGRMFASEYCQEKPDIICLSKGITGGTMALGVTACTNNVYEAFISDDKTKTFYHGHSFTANPLACAVALASLDLLEKKKAIARIERIIFQCSILFSVLRQDKYKDRVKDARQCGTIVAFEMINNEVDSYLNNVSQEFKLFCLERGVFLRSLGNTIYIMPPYCISKKQMKKIFEVILKFLDEKIIPI